MITCSSEDNTFNIPSPTPFIAGNTKKFLFKIMSSDSNQPYDLTSANDIVFSICPFGRSNSTLNFYLSENDVDNPILVIDPDNKNNFNELLVNLYSSNTISFIDSSYVFQITCTSSDGYSDCVLGRGKVDVIGNIRK